MRRYVWSILTAPPVGVDFVRKSSAQVMRLLDEQVQRLVRRIAEEQVESSHNLTDAQKVAHLTGKYFERFRKFQGCLEQG